LRNRLAQRSFWTSFAPRSSSSFLRIPHLHRLILAGRSQALAVRAVSQGGDGVFVGAELADLLAAGCVPKADNLVPAAAGQALAVRAEGDGPDALARLEIEDFLFLGNVKDLDGAVEVAGNHAVALRSEKDTSHIADGVHGRLHLWVRLAFVLY